MFQKRLLKTGAKSLTNTERQRIEADWTNKQTDLKAKFERARKQLKKIESREKSGSSQDATAEEDIRESMKKKGEERKKVKAKRAEEVAQKASKEEKQRDELITILKASVESETRIQESEIRLISMLTNLLPTLLEK